MIIKKELLWENKNSADYIAYLMDNSTDVDIERKHPAIIVCGGGGFMKITEREKEPVALFFLNQGYQVFVLNYTTKATGDSTYPTPLFDLAKMIVTIREHSAEWNIDPDKISVIGFSSGGTLCASLATQWQEPFLSEKIKVPSEMLKPNAAILAYPLVDFSYQIKKISEDKNCEQVIKLVNMKKGDFLKIALDAVLGKNATEEQLESASPINHVTSNMPPVFIWGTADDSMIYMGQIFKFAEKLNSFEIPFELHIFESGNHGLSLANYNTTQNQEEINKDVAVWTKLAISFLNRHI